MRRSLGLLCSGIIPHVKEAVEVSKDYRKIQATREEKALQEQRKKEMENYPLRYQILECQPGLPLALTKLKYLLACRRTHPDAGGDAEMFLRVSLAYQDIMKDYGVETVDNQIVNLGNFQVDDHEAQNYLEARAKIQSYIPLSTLEDHILRIEQVKERLGEHMAEKVAANSDETMWLLEDIEEIMEDTGLKTVRLKVLEDGRVTVADNLAITDGTERPLFLPEEDLSAGAAEAGEKSGEAEAAESKEAAGAQATGAKQKAQHRDATEEEEGEEKSAGGGAAAEGTETKAHAPGSYEVEVRAEDIEVLNAKNTLQDRTDVAGLASRTATEVMRNTQEVKEIKQMSAVLYTLVLCFVVAFYMYVEALFRAKRQQKSRPQAAEHLQSETMLPWWGNDAEYEAQVKRIFVDEWRRARATSRQSQTFQDGVAREGLDEKTRKTMDLQIFDVTSDRLRVMRENAEKHPGRR